MTWLMEGLIEARNPWFPEMSAKPTYKRKPAAWIMDKKKASPALKAVWGSFSGVADESIRQFPADGSFATLKNRVKWIGSQLAGKTFATKLRARLPISATPDHPLVKKYGARAEKRVHIHQTALYA